MVKHPYKVHVWVMISTKGKIGMHLFTENLDRHLYQKILNEHLYDNADALHCHNWIFPDMNPIENVWAVLKGKVKKKIKYLVAKKKNITCDVFLNTIRQEWDDLDDAILLRCIESMPSRVKACINAEGGHTKY